MSTLVAAVNMASIAVGQSGKIDLTQVLSQAPAWKANPPTLQIYNESGVTVSFNSDNGAIQQVIPAGAWPQFQLPPGINNFTWTALSVIPKAPVTTFYAIYYAPNEQVPPTPQLGNSPISGSTTTSSIQTLSNEGNPAGQLVIDIGDSTLTQLVEFFTDHFILQVDKAGIAHYVLRGQTTGNAALIGQTGDTSEVQGQLLVDQLLTAALGIAISASGLSVVGGTITDTLTDNGALTVKGVSSLDNGAISSDGAGNWNVNSLEIGASQIVHTSGTGNTVVQAPAGKSEIDLNDGAGNQMMVVNDSQSAAAPTNATSAATVAKMFFNIGAIKDINGSTSTTCGSGTTISHGLSGTPNLLVATPSIAQPGSATVGIGNLTSTTFRATVGAGTALSWLASR